MTIMFFFLFMCLFGVSIQTNINNTHEAKAKEVCMKELGCFEITKDFVHILHRPINVLPQDRATINTKCLLYTKKNPKESEQLIASDVDSIKHSHVNPQVNTKFIIHGYMDSELYGPWMIKMKDEFLLHGDYNIIIVDWGGGNRGPYFQAAANSRVVGAEVALILNSLQKELGVDLNNVHLIGHSLGAHISGYAGEAVKSAIGRITALDPAEPYFQKMPASVRIDSTDAKYVDVIHSDATNIRFIGFGMSQLVGHVDFFPNNGRKQPGCDLTRLKTFITEGLNEGLRRFASCNHQRAIDFMHYTINYKKVLPVAYECVSWETFLEGKCADCGKDMTKCAIMGLRADEFNHTNSGEQKSYYLKTLGKSPFWLYHYQVSVKLYNAKSSKDTKGTMSVTLVGSKGDFATVLQDKATDLYHGSRYQYLITTDKEIGDIKSITFKWTQGSVNPIKILFKPTIYVEYVLVTPMNVVEKYPRSTENRVFCGKQDTAIKPKTPIVLSPNNKCYKDY